ncbi:TetR/AcrR family transcriptional regulator [Nocardioides sp. KC13]|uniref:TetR/AcrR family transcriptional regulator n=1 Tax=Nocardioides turkmenicus TaxID=2711220 RepID=A0A6M1R0U8_9ACTN|nr:TetR family transcriptional regulator [Nocardioides sp. KC13]NGN95845.1 TetR/AcrR family transcriptional regulator [Nocardioides sp. KC13]
MPQPATKTRLPRAERRAQILTAATRAFARHGFADTGLDEIAEEAGVTRVVLYRHFDSKAELYRTILDQACARLAERVGTDDFEDDAIPALLAAASEDPDAFRLLFRFATREREFKNLTDSLSTAAITVARSNLAKQIPDGPWLDWASRLIPTMTTDAVIAWLDSGQPDPETAAERIRTAIHGISQAAAQPPDHT